MVYEVSCDNEECVFEDDGLCIKSNLMMTKRKCMDSVETGIIKHCWNCFYLQQLFSTPPCDTCDDDYSEFKPKKKEQ